MEGLFAVSIEITAPSNTWQGEVVRGTLIA
jgi:hypothetical protein